MSDEIEGSNVKKGLGVVGALVAIVAVCWFALRPMLHKKDDAES